MSLENTERNLTWATGPNMDLLADCVVDMVLKYNDKTLLQQLDGFNKIYERREDKFSDLVNSIVQKLNLPESKRSALYPQLSTIGCAYKEYRNYNNKLGQKYKKLIDIKLEKAGINNIEFSEKEDIEEELNINCILYEGTKRSRTLTVRERNSKARKFVLERDNYTCQCCGLRPIEIFKNTLHVHHICPLHQSEGTRKVDTNELITLCPTCHAYIHYQTEELTVEEVKQLLNKEF